MSTAEHTGWVAYDRELTERIRDILSGAPDVTEKAMFGGLAFMVNGNMAVAASGQGGLLVRADPADADKLLGRAHVEPMVMRGRPTRGWLRVGVEGIKTGKQLGFWVDSATGYARTLPPK